MAVEAHETVLRALSSFSTPYGELILAEDINKEILFNAMSDTVRLH